MNGFPLPYLTAVPQKSKNLSTTGFWHRYGNHDGLRVVLGRTLILDNPNESEPESILNIGWVNWNENKPMWEDNEHLSNLWHPKQEITCGSLLIGFVIL